MNQLKAMTSRHNKILTNNKVSVNQLQPIGNNIKCIIIILTIKRQTLLFKTSLKHQVLTVYHVLTKTFITTHKLRL